MAVRVLRASVSRRRAVVGLVAAALVAGLFPAMTLTPAAAEPTAPPAAAPAAPRSDITSATERRRVDRVPAPALRWRTCYGTAQCATVRLPRDYDKPSGATVTVALLKRPAQEPSRRIGTLFLNPGGPGASGVEMAYLAPSLLGPEVLRSFDLVGFDPRGTNASSRVRCFASSRAQAPVTEVLSSRPFPYGSAEEEKFIAAYDQHARKCSTTGKPLSGSVSTAEVARDMDVLRRAVGDSRLNFLGFSYGSYLGQVYANMFPDRVRSVAIDGVLDPLRWAGTPGTKADPVGNRLRSADGSWKALREILVRCRQAGPTRCESAALGDPVANFDLVAERLKKNPLIVTPDVGDPFVFGYAEWVDSVLGSLYFDFGYIDIDYNLQLLLSITAPASGSTAAAQSTSRAVATKSLARRLRTAEQRELSSFAEARLDRSYDNSLDAFASITCTDSVNSKNLTSFGRIGAAADSRARYFGRSWLWSTADCSSKRWTVKDEDAYRGPFTRRTLSPVLVVGNYWDPATNYDGAQTVAGLLPNSRLLSSDSWGHTAYGSSGCVNTAVDTYLVSGRVPAAGATCVGDLQPFTESLPVSDARKSAADLGLVRPPAPLRVGAP